MRVMLINDGAVALLLQSIKERRMAAAAAEPKGAGRDAAIRGCAEIEDAVRTWLEDQGAVIE